MKRFNFVVNFLDSLVIDKHISNYLNSEEISNIDSFESLRDVLESVDFFYVEILYYASAIEFLSENDNSLTESFRIANEDGFTLENLNSEKLASLLASEQLKDKFYELENEIDNFFSDLISFEEEAENLNGRIIEENEQVYYIQYDKENMSLCAGTCTNTGFISLVEVEVDTDFSLDENIQSLYKEIERYEQLEA